MNTVTDYYTATASQRGDMLAQIGHGRRRAAASPFDEIARVGTDGQPYWSARDLADLFGYSRWQTFADALRKAREQVKSHVSAGRAEVQDDMHFVNTERIVTGSAVPRTVPDVRLSRFAAYFVALNADQSKPEVRAAVNYYFVGRTIQAEQMIQAGADDNALTAANAKRIADLELAVQGLPEVIGDAIAKALSTATPSAPVEAEAATSPRKRGKLGRPGLPSITAVEQATYSSKSSGAFARVLVADGYLVRRAVRTARDGRSIYEYREGSHVGMFRFRKRPSGPYAASGRYVYVTEAGQRFLAEQYGWETP